MPSIRVIARFRPINSREMAEQEANQWDNNYVVPISLEKDDKDVCTTVTVRSTGNAETDPKFTFDRIMWWDTSQDVAFNIIGLPAVEDVVEGTNSTIFVYGQTGAGKSFTVFGVEPTEECPIPDVRLMGLIPRSVDWIFMWLNKKAGQGKIRQVACELRVFEIYIHNQIKDLLHPAKKGDKKLRIRDGPKGVFVQGLKGRKVESTSDVLTLSVVAQAHRTISKTQMNSVSSRSHCIFELLLSYTTAEGSAVKAKMNFADLAGAEKVKKTGATGKVLEEAKAINQSLTVLGNCIAALVRGQAPPYRESALAHCLKTSLSGNCKTTLVVAASPHRFNMVETISAFQFASRAKMIKTKAKKNTTMSAAQMKKEIARLKGQNKALQVQLAKAGGSGAVGGPEIKVIWEGAKVPEEKERKRARKEMVAYVKELLEKLEASDTAIECCDVDIGTDDPYTATIMFVPDTQCDGDECVEWRDKLYEEIMKAPGPFARSSKTIKHDPISPERFDKLMARVAELEEANRELTTENNGVKNQLFETEEKLKKAQAQLQESSSALKNAKAKNVLSGMLHNVMKKQDEARLSQVSSVSLSTANNLEIGKMGTVREERQSVLSSEVGQSFGIVGTEDMVFTDEANNRKASIMENALAKRKRLEEHDGWVKGTQAMMAQNQALIKRAEMAEEADNSEMITDLLKQLETNDENYNATFAKMTNYFRENEMLKEKGKGDKQEISNFQKAIGQKESMIEGLHEDLAKAQEDLKKLRAIGDAQRENVDTLMMGTDTDRQRQLNKLAQSAAAGLRNENETMRDEDAGDGQPGKIWGILKKKIQQDKDTKHHLELTQTQRAVQHLSGAVHKILADKEDYLRATTSRYMPADESDSDDMKDDDGQYGRPSGWHLDVAGAKDAVDWDVEEVIEWLSHVRNGEFQRFIPRFEEMNVNGEHLLSMKQKELCKVYRMKKEEALALLEEIQELGDDLMEDSEYLEDDLPEDLAATLLESEIEELERLDPADLEDMAGEVWTFPQFREQYPDMPKPLQVKIFSLLEQYQSGVIAVEDLIRFFEACQSEPGLTPDEECELYNDMLGLLGQFAQDLKWKQVFKKHAPRGYLNMHGAKKIIKRLRECREQEIRDQDLGLQFILGTTKQEFSKLLKRCPEATWFRIAKWDPFEMLFREIENFGSHRLHFRKYAQAFRDIGVTHSEGNIKEYFTEMNLEVNRPSPYMITLAAIHHYVNRPEGIEPDLKSFLDELFRKAQRAQNFDDDDDASISSGEEQSMMEASRLAPMGGLNPQASEAMYGGIQLETPRDPRFKDPRTSMSIGGHLAPGGRIAAHAPSQNVAQQQIVLNNQKLVSVRLRLMKFAAFASANVRGFEGFLGNAFTFSSIKEGDPQLACRLNTEQARGASAWVADLKKPNPDNTHHVVAQLGPHPRDLYAVAMQGRADKDEWVTQATIFVSEDGQQWKNLPLTHTFSCKDRNSVAVYPLYSPAHCRFVKIRCEKWHGKPSLRWDCLFV